MKRKKKVKWDKKDPVRYLVQVFFEDLPGHKLFFKWHYPELYKALVRWQKGGDPLTKDEVDAMVEALFGRHREELLTYKDLNIKGQVIREILKQIKKGGHYG